MSTEIAVWNMLHDGCLVGVQGSVPGDVTVAVAIEYLRAMLPETGNSLSVQLIGCCLFEVRRFVGGQTIMADASRRFF